MREIRALTIWEPWATGIALGFKHYETRSWKTDYRGPLAIHAAKDASAVNSPNALVLLGALAERDNWVFHFGCVIAIAELTDCIPAEVISKQLSRDELRWGFYSAGRFAWKLENVVPINPVPAKGRQRLWRFRLPKTIC